MSTNEFEVQPAQAVEVGRAAVRPLPPNKADPIMQDEHTQEEHAQEPLTKSGVADAGERAVMVIVCLLCAVHLLTSTGEGKIQRGSDCAHGRDPRRRSCKGRVQGPQADIQPWRLGRLSTHRRHQWSALQTRGGCARERSKAPVKV